MLKKLIPISLTLLFLLSACSPQPQNAAVDSNDSLSLVATTYPIYLFCSEATKGVDGITVSPLVNQEISCLHNYTLTVNDMQLLEGADVIIMNGGGLDSFVSDGTLSNSKVAIVNCSDAVPALYTEHTHNHIAEAQKDADAHHMDPHFWMDPERAGMMLQTISDELIALDPMHEAQYRANTETAMTELGLAKERLYTRLEGLPCRELITFHDGFSYFADAFDLTILTAIEEEEEQAASAKVISDTIRHIQEHNIPAIFTEYYGSDSTAQAIARELGITVYPLSMMMSGETDDPGLSQYLSTLEENIDTIVRAYS